MGQTNRDVVALSVTSLALQLRRIQFLKTILISSLSSVWEQWGKSMLHIIIYATSSSKKIYCIVYLTARQEETGGKG